MGNVVMTSDEWTDEERAQLAAVSAEYNAAEGAVQAAAQRLDDAVEAAHAAGERMILRLLRERNEAVAKLAAVEGADLPLGPPGTFYWKGRLQNGDLAMVCESSQRPSLVVNIPLAEMTAPEGRDLARAILRVCRSLEAQAAQEAEGTEP